MKKRNHKKLKNIARSHMTKQERKLKGFPYYRSAWWEERKTQIRIRVLVTEFRRSGGKKNA